MKRRNSSKHFSTSHGVKWANETLRRKVLLSINRCMDLSTFWQSRCCFEEALFELFTRLYLSYLPPSWSVGL